MCLGPGRIRLLLLLQLIVSAASAPRFTVTADRGTIITISSTQTKGCHVCTGSGRSQQCSSSVSITDNKPVSLEFSCARPQDVFIVEIEQTIECFWMWCSSHTIQSDFGSLPLLDFKRRFIWNVKASTPMRKSIKVDFTETAMRQVHPSQSCPDYHTYKIQAFQSTGTVDLGTYCRTGTINSVQILNEGRISLDVPAGYHQLEGQIHLSTGEEIKSLAKITLTLPKGTSSSELLSPNYPLSFPDDDVMEWFFQVPDKHKAAVQFLNLTLPQCLKKDTGVEYHNKGRGAWVLGLTDAQPTQSQGDFSITLRNCEMDRRRAGSSGLSVNIRVSASSVSPPPVSCKVDPSRLSGVSLHIDKVRPTSDCRMKMNSVAKENITITSNSEVSFEDCLPDDVHITGTKLIVCRNANDCPRAPVPLLVPFLPSCLPFPLRSVTWTLRPAQHSTVRLTSPTGDLKQSLPGQICKESILFKVAEENGATIGHFCPRGAMQAIQIHTNMSVTWLSSMPGRIQRSYYKYVLNASFEKEIPERYIFTISPSKNSPFLVATPGWPMGMEHYSTVSWMVSVPSNMRAHLVFTNLSQPKCSNGHTSIRVQRVGSPEEDYSRSEIEEAQSEITVSESFYLNMSNCMPETGDFGVITKITLREAKRDVLTIILSVVAALLVIFIVVLVTVCVVVRKKKKMLQHQVSVYNPNGTSFLPGYNGLPKREQDSESHVYESIEDTLVYTHLLRKGVEIGVYGETDTYCSFPGQTDSQKPLMSKDSRADGMEVSIYRPFEESAGEGPPLPNRPPSHIQSMVDNEIYQTEGQSEQEQSPNLGPRLEPEGGDGGED
ncbi:CUB domain-containing protein 1-like [Gouania willdenowi]|uniref:CUB domain-containing protein 1 n=1 Tax=Gouania willdenowi TaxID=441366 RepID=A0A8C5EUX0_GOUWI|nr:CUB domain-containing protein 1 [Gouania willdenowi]